MTILVFFFLELVYSWTHAECDITKRKIYSNFFVDYYTEVVKLGDGIRTVQYTCVQKPVDGWAQCYGCNPTDAFWQTIAFLFVLLGIGISMGCCCCSMVRESREKYAEELRKLKSKNDPKKTDETAFTTFV
jgi:hypothetical protein